MKQNMGAADRMIRLLLAVAFACLFYMNVISGVIANALWVLGLIFVLTSAVGFCPLYVLAGLSTKKKR